MVRQKEASIYPNHGCGSIEPTGAGGDGSRQIRRSLNVQNAQELQLLSSLINFHKGRRCEDRGRRCSILSSAAMAALLGSRLKAHRKPKISIVPTALDTIPQQNDSPVSPTSHVGSKRESAITEAPGRPPIKEHNINNVKFDVMLMYLRQQQLEKRWASGNSTEGVVLRRSRNDYICQPPELLRQVNGFYDEVKKLNFKVWKRITRSFGCELTYC